MADILSMDVDRDAVGMDIKLRGYELDPEELLKTVLRHVACDPVENGAVRMRAAAGLVYLENNRRKDLFDLVKAPYNLPMPPKWGPSVRTVS